MVERLALRFDCLKHYKRENNKHNEQIKTITTTKTTIIII